MTALLVALLAGAAPELTDRNFDELLATVLPEPDEVRWRQIPWRPTLWDAVVEAAQHDRPVLLWAMNGHPLGCT